MDALTGRMSTDVRKAMSLSGLWVGIAASVATLGTVSAWLRSITKDLDDDLLPETRTRFAENLHRATGKNADWMVSFGQLFIRVFGKRQLSWLCVRRSLAMSASTFVFIGLATGPFYIDTSKFAKPGLPAPALWALWLLALALLGIVVNGLFDYLSLWITRTILRSRLSVPSKIIVGLGATAILVYVLTLVIIFLLVYFGLTSALHFKDAKLVQAVFLEFVLLAVQFMHIPPTIGTIAFVVWATTFSTMIWLVLHVASVFIIRVVPSTFSILDIRNKPVRAIGLVASILVWSIGIVVLAGIYFANR